YFIMEIIDPKTGELVGEGERGELVFTPLWKEAMPIFRYRTRDISRAYEDECNCGLPFRRIERLHGRSDDMLIIRGVNVFPSQIEEVILKNSAFKGHYAIIVERKGPLDLLTVEIEVTKDLFTGNLKDLIELKDKVEEDLKSVLLVKANVKLVEEGTIPRSQGKAQRVIDKRNLE
ncbi:MAG: phenylacetate--CoA ligase, partial [Candidatus Methanofastidiosa archaeon]|nr:phenylacetate--CoA ligase [Candidatus Methanofastidiosa archaeon]